MSVGAAGAPLTTAQAEFRFGEVLRPGSANMLGTVVTLGSVDLGLAVAAAEALARRHDALRTAFRQGPGGTVQVVTPPVGVDVDLIDARRLDPEARRATVDAEVQRRFAAPFALATGSLLRLLLVRSPDHSTTVAMVTNHLVADNWSMKVLWRELFALNRDPEIAPTLPTSTVTIAELACWEAEQVRTGGFEPAVAAVRAALDGGRCPPAGGARRTEEVASLAVDLGAEARTRLDGVRRQAGATVFAVALALFGRALGRSLQEDDLVAFVPVANRDAENWYAIGPFANTVPVRIAGWGAAPLVVAIERARATVLAAITVGRVPLGLLLRALGPATRGDLIGPDRLRATVREIAGDAGRSIRPVTGSGRRAAGSGVGGQNPGLPMDLLLEVGASTLTLTYDVGSVGTDLAAHILDLMVEDLAGGVPGDGGRLPRPRGGPDDDEP